MKGNLDHKEELGGDHLAPLALEAIAVLPPRVVIEAAKPFIPGHLTSDGSFVANAKIYDQPGETHEKGGSVGVDGPDGRAVINTRSRCGDGREASQQRYGAGRAASSRFGLPIGR